MENDSPTDPAPVQAIAISRTDFYSTLVAIWTFAMMLSHRVLIAEQSDPTLQDYVLFGSAFALSMTYSVLLFLETRKRRQRPRGFPIEPK